MIVRTKDAEFINRIANDPDVYPSMLARDGEYIDMSGVVASDNNLCLVGEHGSIIFHQALQGLYELHIAVLPSGRGLWAMKFLIEALDMLFCRTNATEVYYRVSSENIRAAMMARAMASVFAPTKESSVVQNLNGSVVNVEIFSGRIQDWMKTAPGLVERGQKFCAELLYKAAELGLASPFHGDDDWRDRHLGMVIAMLRGGAPSKGVIFFNRWASFALHSPMKLISFEPLIVSVGECVFEVQSDDIEIVPQGDLVSCLKH